MMGYTIGVSSGMWSMAKQGSPIEGEMLQGIPKKILWTITKGVNFTQVDLETIAEFKEPNLAENVKRVKAFGQDFGIHAETAATAGAHTMPLESALEFEYILAHDRLIEHINGSGKIGAKYCMTHASELHPFIVLGKRQLEPFKIVDVWGRPIKKFLEEHPEILDWAIEQPHIMSVEGMMSNAKALAREKMQELERTNKEFSEKDYEKLVKQKAKEILLNSGTGTHLAYGVEKVAYFIMAKWMMDSNDYLWSSMVGEKIPDNKLAEEKTIIKWVPAVTAKYIWGHFSQDKCPSRTSFEDPKPLLEKYKMVWGFETAMSEKGLELYMRLGKLHHLYYLAKSIKSPWMCYVMDMEHMLGSNIDPKEDIAKLPQNGGELLKIVHVGVPTPLNPSHTPIQIGSEAQYYVYERLFELRKKGFKDGWIIFERAGGEDPIQGTVASIRLMVEFLNKDIEPKKLPLDFFGMKETGPEFAMQQHQINEHALDPLKGLLQVPEEEHGFLSSQAQKKGKLAEWAKEEYR